MNASRPFRPASTPPGSAALRGLLATALAATIALALGCGSEHRAPTAPMGSIPATGSAMVSTRQTLAEVLSIQERYGDALLELYGVEGDGVGMGADGAPVIKAYVARTGLRIPSQIQGVRVEQEVTGAFALF